MGFWRKRLFCILCVIILTFAAGCGQERPAARQPKEIVIWTWDDTFNVKAAKLAAAQYMKNNSTVKFRIETKEKEEILSNIKAIFASGLYDRLPDLITVEDYDIQEMLGTYESQFMELTEEVDYSSFVDYKKQLCGKDGHYYGKDTKGNNCIPISGIGT